MRSARDQDELHLVREAHRWRIKLQNEGRACHAPFTTWLLESKKHVKAYLIATAITARVRGSDSRREIDVEELISVASDRSATEMLVAAAEQALRMFHEGRDPIDGVFCVTERERPLLDTLPRADLVLNEEGTRFCSLKLEIIRTLSETISS